MINPMTAIIDLGDAWPWPVIAESRRKGESTWFRTSEANYWQALDAVPPKYFPGGFFMGEASAHDDRGVAVYAAFVEYANGYYCREVARDKIVAAMSELRLALIEAV